MLLPNISLSKEDFATSNWENIVNGCNEKKNENYAMLFLAKADEAKLASEVKKQAIFTLLAGITAPSLSPDTSNEPFGQTDFINSINDGYLNALKDWASEINDAELRARIADLIWLKKRDFSMVQLAIDSYLKSAQNLGNPTHWRACINRIERAMRLARQLNYHFDNVVACIELILTKYQDEDPSLLWARLMQLLQDNKEQGDPLKYAVLAEKAATCAEVASDWYKAREYWQIKRKWHLIAKDKQKAWETELNICETYVKEAEDAIKRTPPSYLAASTYLQQAIEAFRKTSGTQQRVEETHRKLLEYQELVENEMIHLHQEVDISRVVSLVKNKVKDKSFQDAIFCLASLYASPKVDGLRSQVENNTESNPLQFNFPMTIINDMGKVTAKQPSILSSNEDEVEEAIKAEMYKSALQHQLAIAQAIIEPAREQILLEHNVHLSDWFLILVNSPFVPKNREYIYAEGLQAGLRGNFLIATHLLMPQIENSIRYLLHQCGVITSKNTSKGIQDEYDLNTTLYLIELENILGKDLCFDLQGLLVNRFGTNLRNRMAHGLIDYNGFFSSHSSYLWWLTLRLCFLPILSQIQIRQQEANETSESREADTSTSTNES
jgi:hypothetical protein